MKISFGIITDGQNNDRVEGIVASIRLQNIPRDHYEIIIVGGGPIDGQDIRHIPFNDVVGEKGKISIKKNLIAQTAKYDILCILHDYIKFEFGWYQSYKNFGTDWDCSLCKIKNIDGSRFRDLVYWHSPTEIPANGDFTVTWADYNDPRIDTKKLYISGAFFLVKKQYFLNNPLENWRNWDMHEDINWSLRCRQTWNYKFNKSSAVSLMKEKQQWPPREKAWGYNSENSF